jgi:deoxyribodipyrimidine photolyase
MHCVFQRLFAAAYRLSRYATLRQDPLAAAQSNLSPYLAFGQLGTQRAALAVATAAADAERILGADVAVTSAGAGRDV